MIFSIEIPDEFILFFTIAAFIVYVIHRYKKRNTQCVDCDQKFARKEIRSPFSKKATYCKSCGTEHQVEKRFMDFIFIFLFINLPSVYVIPLFDLDILFSFWFSILSSLLLLIIIFYFFPFSIEKKSEKPRPSFYHKK
ncbi:MAG: TIGR04104 family putative zinc finger protein [Anaerobacillus sp.]|uniref:TIGR04104 family putative zinc finger protein n=1 Tax=Anaerobacillus sp. TaxID=1872506 RepID=UPI00391A7A53